MSTYTQILYQIVFGTNNRERIMIASGQESLYKYIWEILENKKCNLYRIGGVEDHLHFLTHIHPAIAPAYLIKDIKIASSAFINTENVFPDFNGWQDAYVAFTYFISAKDNLIEYVKNQKEHHQKVSFQEEYFRLRKEHGIEFDEKYLL